MPDSTPSERGNSDSEKADQQFEIPGDTLQAFGSGQFDDKPFVGVRRLLKRNPSLEFCRDVVQMNKEVLDPVEVRKVEPHNVMLIVPQWRN
jgi:hypothetical protein